MDTYLFVVCVCHYVVLSGKIWKEQPECTVQGCTCLHCPGLAPPKPSSPAQVVHGGFRPHVTARLETTYLGRNPCTLRLGTFLPVQVGYE